MSPPQLSKDLIAKPNRPDDVTLFITALVLGVGVLATGLCTLFSLEAKFHPSLLVLWLSAWLGTCTLWALIYAGGGTTTAVCYVDKDLKETRLCQIWNVNPKLDLDDVFEDFNKRYIASWERKPTYGPIRNAKERFPRDGRAKLFVYPREMDTFNHSTKSAAVWMWFIIEDESGKPTKRIAHSVDSSATVGELMMKLPDVTGYLFYGKDSTTPLTDPNRVVWDAIGIRPNDPTFDCEIPFVCRNSSE